MGFGEKFAIWYNEDMQHNAVAFVQLLQLADSALPVGTAAHSFGLETLVDEGWLKVEELETFLRDYLVEAGALECTFCLLGYRLTTSVTEGLFSDLSESWLALNARLSAIKTARESREASAAMGRRLLQLAQGLELHPLLPNLIPTPKTAGSTTHYSVAFGLLGWVLQVGATHTGLCYLPQSLTWCFATCTAP